MGNNSGNIVTWQDANGNEKRGYAYHRDQTKGLSERNMVACTEVDEKNNPVMIHGRRSVKLVASDKVKRIGYFD